MDNKEMNYRIVDIDSADRWVGGPMARHGKVFPYIGWYWREVDFSRPFPLGDCGVFIGFMENNKWDYPEWLTTPEQTATIRQMMEDIVADTTQDKIAALYDYLQTCRPTRGESE